MRNRMYGGVRGRKTKVGENYFVFLLLDYIKDILSEKTGYISELFSISGRTTAVVRLHNS